MRIRAPGSIWVIFLTASIPPISGMMISIVTRSGFSCWYFSTACLPFSASPTTVNPACDRMSLTIVRMNTASSQTNTVLLLTLPPVSDYLLNHRFDVEHENSPAIDFDCSSHRPRYWDVRLANDRKLIDRHILNVTNIVHSNPYPALEVIDQQNQPVWPPERRATKCEPAVDDRNDRPPQVDQPTDGVWRPRQPCGWLDGNDFAERIHVASEHARAYLEHEEAPRRDVRRLFNDLLGRNGDGVTHRIGTRSADRPRSGGRALRQ